MSSLRVVSLVPSITELIVDLGLQRHLVGRTGFCIHPASQVQNIPKVGGTKALLLDKIKALAPTHVVVNVDENEKPDVDVLRQWVPHVVVTHPQSPQDNLALIDQLVAAFHPLDATTHSLVQERAQQLKQAIGGRYAALKAQQTQQVPQRVLYLIWREPWMTVARDTYIGRMLSLIGWDTWPDVQGGDGLHTPGAARYPVVKGNEAWLRDIQRVLLSSEPYRFGDQHVAEVQHWLQQQGAQAQVQLVDGEMLSWYGSRAVAGLDYLSALSKGTAALSSA